jgi:hypothetical protein
MGIFRGGLLVIVSVLFLISGLFMSTFLVFQNSVSYENINNELSTHISSILDDTNFERDLERGYSMMVKYCENNSEYTFYEKNTLEVFSLDCALVKEGQNAVKEKLLSDLLDKVYYETYDCDFWNCYSKTGSFLFLFSQKAYDYWGRWFYSFLILSLILFASIILLAVKKSNAFILSGILLALSVLHLLFFDKIVGRIPYVRNFSFLFISSGSIFWTFVIISLLSIFLGISIKLFSIGFKISHFFEKFKSKNKPKKPFSEDIPLENKK